MGGYLAMLGCRTKELAKPLEPHMTTNLLSALAKLFSFVYKNHNSPQLLLGLTHNTIYLL